MSGALDTIKSYLVSLGFQVNSQEFSKLKQTLNDASKAVEAHTSGMAANYAKAAGIVVGALGSITAATVATIDKIAQADLNWQKFALRMYMTNDAARKLKITTDALGESLDDIAWLPELRGRYIELMNQARGIEAGMPRNMEGSLKNIRDIRFEFTRMKVEATYSIMYISYYLQRYLGKDVHDLHGGLRNLNDWITQKMPEWTSKVASWLGMILQLGTSLLRPFQDLAYYLNELWDKLDKNGKMAAVIAGLTTLFAIFGPTGRIAMAFSGLILLVDDFYAYLDGRKSSNTLAPIWYTIISVVEKLTKGLWLAGQAASWLAGNRPAKSKGFLGDMKDLWNNAGEGFRTESLLDSIGRPGPSGKAAPGLQGIGKVESSGNYGAVNKDTGAFGKYQILPSNWSAWSYEAGLPKGAQPTPANQEFVASFKWNQYLSRYKSPQLAAAAWYAGEGYANSIMKGRPLFSPYAAQGKYLSVDDYVYKATGQHLQIGSVNITIGGTNASVQEIHDTVYTSILEATRRATDMRITRNLRDAQGVYP